MKKLIYLGLLLAFATVITPVTQVNAQPTGEASFVGRNPNPTQAQRRLFSRLQNQLRRLPVGSPRALSLANRMINLVPDAAVAVVNLATQKLVTVSAAESLVVLATNAIATFDFPVDRAEVLLINASRTVANVAQSIPRIVATSESGTPLSTFNQIIGIATSAIVSNPNISQEITDFVDSNLATATPPPTPGPTPEPTPVPTPTPVPYGA